MSSIISYSPGSVYDFRMLGDGKILGPTHIDQDFRPARENVSTTLSTHGGGERAYTDAMRPSADEIRNGNVSGVGFEADAVVPVCDLRVLDHDRGRAVNIPSTANHVGISVSVIYQD